jgi:hypothetical protein
MPGSIAYVKSLCNCPSTSPKNLILSAPAVNIPHELKPYGLCLTSDAETTEWTRLAG